MMCRLCAGQTIGRNLLLSFDVNVSITSLAWSLSVAIFLVDVDFLFTPTGTAIAVFFVNSYVFLKAAVLTGAWSLGRAVASIVTFPSDARSGKVDLLVYLDVCRLCDSITPIRGREDCGRVLVLYVCVSQAIEVFMYH